MRLTDGAQMVRAVRKTGAGLAMLLALVVFLLGRGVLSYSRRRNWPPPDDAVTADGAEAAVHAFVARPGARPADVDVPFAWSTADEIEPWPDGATFFPRMLDDFEAATSSVHILMFGWREGEIGTRIADLLVEKLADGLDVRIAVDSQGSKAFAAAAAMFDRLRAAGAEVVVNRALPWQRPAGSPFGADDLDWRRRAAGRVDHRKLAIVDGRVAWIGGAGFEDHFLDGRFKDVMTRVTGDVVRQAQALFLLAFAAHGGAVRPNVPDLLPRPARPGAIPVALLQVVPGGFASATDAIHELVESARSRLDVVNPYLTDRGTIGRLAAAARRGVHVRVVVSERSNNAPATAALKGRLPGLLDAGVEVFEYPGAVVHTKLVVADDAVLFGTVNLDAWALYRNYEVAMLARSADVADLFRERVVEPDIAASARAAPLRGLRPRAASVAWAQLSYFL